MRLQLLITRSVVRRRWLLMLIDWLLDFLAAGVAKFWALIEGRVPAPPGWVNSGAFYISDVMNTAASLDAWVPISLAAPVLLFIPIAIVFGLGLKLLRIVVSFMTLGGGGAG